MPTYDLIVEVYMPNQENLKKLAKLILRWHREGHYPVAAQIRGHLPRFPKPGYGRLVRDPAEGGLPFCQPHANPLQQ